MVPALEDLDGPDDGDDHFHDECGVFGVYGHEEAANLTYLGLHALQHRGQESAGIATIKAGVMSSHRGMGLVQDVFTPAVIDELQGDVSIGHVRYSTAGGSHIKNAQPFVVEHGHMSLACAHNGNLTNADELKEMLDKRGAIFQTTTDTEVVMHLVAHAPAGPPIERIIHALRQVKGAYSMLFLAGDTLVAIRDPHGFRPLCLGLINRAHVVASEPTAFDLIAAEFVREVEPGEMLVIDRTGEMKSLRPFDSAPARMCVFEYVYFARPDSALGGRSVYTTRRALGHRLAKDAPVDADVVIGVPDSGVPAAIGYAEESGVPFQMGLIRSHYVGRTFIEPQQSIRHFGVRLKLNPVREVLQGKRVVVVDDSIVRGTTSRKIVKMLRDAGAREVHLRISSPPTRWPCFYGIDTPNRRELIAASHSIEEISRYITTDSLAYLSVEGMRKSVGYPVESGDGFCEACFTGEYPVPFVPSSRLVR